MDVSLQAGRDDHSMAAAASNKYGGKQVESKSNSIIDYFDNIYHNISHNTSPLLVFLHGLDPNSFTGKPDRAAG
jgi:hypothetical protein